MEVRVVHDVSIVYQFLKNKTKYDYVYQFSNLSPNQWKNVVCYGLFDGDEIKEIAMVIINYHIPVLLSVGFDDAKNNIELLKQIKRFLPPHFYAHIDKATLEEVFAQNNISELEEFMNMGLCNYDVLANKQANKQENNQDIEAVRLGVKELPAIKELMVASYPEAWLDDDLVKLNENFGIYIAGQLISFAGIHAYSEQYQVAAVAHVTTHPDYRKRGYADKVVKSLSNSLKGKIKFIGLNVKVNNFQAITCYKRLGFHEFGTFIACEIENNR